MKTILVILMMFLTFNSYSQECSERYQKGVDLTTKSLALVLKCENEEAVRVSVDRVARKLNFCKKNPICASVGKAGAYIVQKQIPVEWECSPEIAMKALEIALTKTCERLTGPL
jgi:hypothetical protein